MASTQSNRHPNPNFILSPHQQHLLFAALNSNKSGPVDTNALFDDPTMATSGFDNSLHEAPGSATLTNLDESPFIDYEYDFDNDGLADGNFGDYDFSNISQHQMIGAIPGTSSDGDNETHDKRSHPDDDENEEDGGGKRREGDDKSSKKPGRKPLTSEPTSKRKAQNRAAQRAFRERKEKHLKDLETKVQDLEKASESANHENIILRAKVEKMATELKEYRKRLASQAGNNRISPGSGGMPSYLAGKGLHSIISNPNDVNFSFEFPKFGKLPGPPVFSNPPANVNKTASPPAPPSRSASLGTSVIRPTDQQSPHSAKLNSGTPDQNAHDMSQFSGLFSPPTAGATKDNSFDYIAAMNEASRSSSGSTTVSASTSNNTSHSSPASSNSNHGLSSSCGTSPEPYTQSPPSFKADATLTRIGEEHNDPTIAGEATFCKKLAMACGNPSNPIPKLLSHNSISGNLLAPGFDINGIDWFAQQNNNQFDPQLFGDYREPQDNILAGGLHDDTFFNEAFALPDFGSPFMLEPAVPPKRDLVSEIDAKLNKDEDVVPADPSDMLSCTTIWEKLSSCPRVQNGEIDMDSLCTQLQQKAKCSGDGPVIQENDFKEVLNSMLTSTGKPACEDKL